MAFDIWSLKMTYETTTDGIIWKLGDYLVSIKKL